MTNNFFITGPVKSGKTTVLYELVKELRKKGFIVGGFISPEETHHGTREGFYIEDIETEGIANLASIGGNGPKSGKYNVNVKEFEALALKSMKNPEKYDLLVIDEIGKMEMMSTRFQDTLADILEKEIPVVASLHGSYVNTYEIFGRLYRLTDSNRGQVYSSVLRNVVKSVAKKGIVKVEKVKNNEIKTKATETKVNKKKYNKTAKTKKAETPEHKKERKETGLLGKLKKALGF